MARSNHKSYCHEVKRKIRLTEKEFMAQQIKENGITPISGGYWYLSAQFPNAWKIAKVTPILKESDWEIPNNYRPISLLPCFQRFVRELPTISLYPF